ncbi:sigma-54 interaction domain-containing protein [Fusibacter ferrireducens]|uniref:Sigma 54-interacting transcriptional regulator n=1 Tax=Fusibacter ferrireducens TaxID=2785058 RepID=A0ABR9ZPT0_9FIRM|nr:sigma 54-interacting transcriptional regulator [Fusibacter ferrireducens]MBF4692424.1 sigma 54-interacting transcriptional regulator [Fusibacter ferrireducens]
MCEISRENIVLNLISNMVENSHEGIMVVSITGEILFCNSYFERILEKPAPEIEGSSIETLMPQCTFELHFKSAKAQWGKTLTIGCHQIVVHKTPFYVEAKWMGSILRTAFPTMEAANQFAERILPRKLSLTDGKLHTCMDIIGETEPMLLVKKMARKASRSISNLLVTGESGTGKTIMVEAIHNRSSRSHAPFVKVNCAAIPENLLESELFGYAPGAFTGANREGKPGKFEAANGGTLFLDEIGDMPLYMQAKMLQAIQDRRIERVGSNTFIELDVRIIAATNRDLKAMIQAGTFREDLYYRLKVLEINMPSLRDIKTDIPRYAEGLLVKITQKLGTTHRGFTPESMAKIMAYHWPGNVRQLENFIEQAANFIQEDIIDVNQLTKVPWDKSGADAQILHPTMRLNDDSNPTDDLNTALNNLIEDTEKQMISMALIKCNGNKTKAAELLEINRTVLYKKMKRLNMALK